jgi:hypothetical protein
MKDVVELFKKKLNQEVSTEMFKNCTLLFLLVNREDAATAVIIVCASSLDNGDRIFEKIMTQGWIKHDF